MHFIDKNKNDLPAGKQTQVDFDKGVNTLSKIDCAKIYAENGFIIFPCVPNSKNPAVKWKDLATDNIDVVNRWWSDNPDYNIGVVADNHLVLDVDTKPNDELDGFSSLKKHPDLPHTFMVTTPSGGRHYYFDIDDPKSLTIATGFEDGLDIRAGGKGYTLGVGSTINGVRYTTKCESFYMAPVPDWVEHAAQVKRPQALTPKLVVNNTQRSRYSLEEVERALSSADPDDGYGTWIKIGMAIHSEYPDDDGLQLWDDWSSRGSKYKPGECEKQWSGFDERGGITIATLFYYTGHYIGADDSDYCEPSIYGENDTTLADHFIAKYESIVIYDATNKQWLVFDAGIWLGAEDAERIVIRYYKDVVLDLKRQVQVGCPIPMSMKWLNQAMNQASQRSVLKLVEKQLAQGIHKFDANPYLLGMRDQIYEMPIAKIRPAAGRDLVLKSVGVGYDANATCPEWEKFLRTVMQDDEEMIGFLQRLIGYFLTASVAEQLIFFFYGSGANGKSTFLDLVKALLGDYSVKIVSDAIMRSKSGERSNTVLASLANLLGARLAITDEIGDNAVFDTQSLKSISGDDETVARPLYGNPITFKSTAKLVMFGNDKPYGNINDEGFWRRLCFIHFKYVLPPDRRDPNLLQKLKAEMSGILNWALIGLVQWRQQGLNVPQKVLDDSVEYRKELDSVTEYFDENIAYQLGETVTTKALFDGYKLWCEENLLPIELRHSFSRKASQYFNQKTQVFPYKTNKSRGYKGVKLK